ncbi:hypothetical protein DL93DRAFT_2076722 [Clavulina sp. PMI_390]|nr:hypothetical protein DL93DRAFT_2076722 [Clavulina sp. PMI_390]
MFHSSLIGPMFHVLTASHLGLMAFVVHVTYHSFGSKPALGKIYPPLLKVHNSLSIITDKKSSGEV